MRAVFSPRFSINQENRKKIERILQELPVEIFSDDGSFVVPIVRRGSRVTNIHLEIPKGSTVRVYDREICEHVTGSIPTRSDDSNSYLAYAKRHPGTNRKVQYHVRLHEVDLL